MTTLYESLTPPMVDASMIGPNGFAKKDEAGRVWTFCWATKGTFAGNPEIRALEATNPDGKVLHCRVFLHKPIFFNRLEAMKSVFGDETFIILAASGYTLIGAEKCLKWGVTEDKYVAAAEDILTTTVLDFQRRFPDANIGFVDGASGNYGIDKALISVAKALNLKHLGFTCPNFAFYIADDDMPVFMAIDQSEYSEAFVASCHIMLAMNGRDQALNSDITFCVRHHKMIIPISILATIAARPPAGYDENDHVEDAVEALYAIFKMLERDESSSYDNLKRAVSRRVLDYSIPLLPGASAFSHAK